MITGTGTTFAGQGDLQRAVQILAQHAPIDALWKAVQAMWDAVPQSVQNEVYAKGDNGLGAWGDKTSTLDVPMCALRPHDIARFGLAHNSVIQVVRSNATTYAKLTDKLPDDAPAVIDLNPRAAKDLGIPDDNSAQVSWEPA